MSRLLLLDGHSLAYRAFFALPESIATRAEDLGLPLGLLTERQREVLFLHYYADLDYTTIAQALGISSGTVGATLSAARQTLRGALMKEASRR